MAGAKEKSARRPTWGTMLDPASIPWPPWTDERAWRDEAKGLVRELQAVHAAAFRQVLSTEPARRELGERLAAAQLAAAFARGLQARLLSVRDALAARGLVRPRFDEMVDGGWDAETFPCLWVDLHAMLRDLERAQP